jgi:hypothetical protein
MDTLDGLTISRIIRLFSINTEGIQLHLFKQKYKFQYGSSFKYKSVFVINSLVEANYVKIWPDPFQGGELIMIPTQTMLDFMHDQQQPNYKRPSKSCNKTKNVKIARMRIPDEVKESSKCGVVVSCIANPRQFWFQIKGEEYSDKLRRLDEEMAHFYRSKEGVAFTLTDTEKKALSSDMVRNPQIVAAPFGSKIHRALVLSRPTAHNISVLFVDYGNTSEVPISGLYRLKPEYYLLPCQAVLARETNLSKYEELSIETICQLDKIHPIIAHFEDRFDKCDEYWPVNAVPVQLYNKHNQSIISLVQETLESE